MNRRRLEKLLQSRLFYLLSGIVPLIAFSLSMILLFIQQQDNAIKYLLKEAGNNTAHVVERAIGEQIGLLKSLATSRSLDNGNFTYFRMEAQRLRDLHPEWRTIILTNETQPFFNLNFPTGESITPLRDPTSLEKVWSTKKPFVGDLANNYVAIRVPVIRNGLVIYTLVAPTDPIFFKTALQISPKSPEWGFIIVGSDGIVISASDNAPTTQGKPLHQAFLQNKKEIFSISGMLYSAPVAITSGAWRLIVFASEDSVEAPFVKKRTVVYLAGGASGILAIVLMLIFGSAMTTNQKAIFQRKQMEERLEAQLRQNEAVKAGNVGLWDLDLITNQVSYSPEWKSQIGYEKDEIENDYKEWENRVHPEDLNPTLEKIRQSISEVRKGLQVKFRFRHRDGTYRWILSRASIISDESGRPLRMIGSHVDITDRIQAENERKKLETQLMQAQKMEAIGTLAGGIAHDFNNILGIIVGNTELALDDVPEWNPAYSSLKEIKTASLRATSIVKQLLSFSRKTDQKLQPIEVAIVIKDALKFLRSTIPSTIDIHQEIQTTDETILADPTQINQIMMNLCINASHAMEQTRGKLTITVENVTLDDNSAKDYPDLKSGNHVKIMVGDTGPGIDPEIIDRIFDPYFTTKGVGKGSGMGLAMVHGIVKSHSGSITVDSALGKGTKFSILFPLAQEKAAVEAKTIQEMPRGKETILFVDDEISIVNMVQRMFERLGYKVQTAITPQDALDRFALNPDHFDLVITDMTMPQMTGVKLSEKLMEIRPDIPIIICTGYSALVDEEKAKELGLAAYVMKPINMSEVAQTIRKVLDRNKN